MTDNLIAEMIFKQLMTVPENTKCFDCGKNNCNNVFYRQREPIVGLNK